MLSYRIQLAKTNLRFEMLAIANRDAKSQTPRTRSTTMTSADIAIPTVRSAVLFSEALDHVQFHSHSAEFCRTFRLLQKLLHARKLAEETPYRTPKALQNFRYSPFALPTDNLFF